MESQPKTTEVLNDLVKINNDRIEGYEKAIKQTDDADLKTLFTTLIGESQHYTADLNKYLSGLGEEQETDSTLAGKLYRTWMDVKVSFGGNDRHAILASCEYGEDAAQKSYRQALAQNLPPEVEAIVQQQQRALKVSHDKIRHLRDIEAVNK